MIEGTEEWNAEFETVKTIFRRCPSISIVPLLNRMERLAGRMGVHPYTLHLLFYMQGSEVAAAPISGKWSGGGLVLGIHEGSEDQADGVFGSVWSVRHQGRTLAQWLFCGPDRFGTGWSMNRERLKGSVTKKRDMQVKEGRIW